MAASSTTYKTKWKSGETKVIRVPEVMVDKLMEIAKRWDDAGALRLREEDGVYLIETPRKPVRYSAAKAVNVATVSHRSPFRYPGGKTWLVPQIRCWLLSRPAVPARFIEPFAGGAIASMTVGFERLARQVIFAEMDAAVASVWRVVLNGGADWLAKQILSFDVTYQNVKSKLSEVAESLRERAFHTILRNRVQRGGIMAEGAGLIKVGENGRGLKSRWYPETLAGRIRAINERKDRFSFIEGDAFALMEEYAEDAGAVFYLDPPYTKAARRLYTTWDVDHRRLFALAARLSGDFLMSYDDTPEVRDLAREHGMTVRSVVMKNTHHETMGELLIGRDLSWVGR